MKMPSNLPVWVLLTLALWIGLTVPAAALDKSSAQAGWAEVEITPPLGLAMGGRGPTETVGTKVLDPLMAQVLCLQDTNGTLFVLVSMDLIGMTHDLSDRIRLGIVQETAAELELVVLNFSHTHAGPQMTHTLFAGVGPIPENEKTYYDTLNEKIRAATRKAFRLMTPVKVEVFEGNSRLAINRRAKNAAGHISMNPNPAGPIADKLWLLKLTPEEQALAPILIFSYACHPVIVYGGEPSAISADFPGLTRQLLNQQLKVRSQFIQGLAGDVRPRVLADLQKKRFHAGKPEDLKSAATQLAEDVTAALDQPGTVLQLNLAGSMEEPLLHRNAPPPASYYSNLLATTKSKPMQAVSRYWLKCYQSGEGFAKADPWPTGLIRLANDQWICYFAGEPCVEWAPLVAQWLAPRKVVLWGYSQESNTYLPTDELLPQGGYEVLESNRARVSSPAQFAPGLNKAIQKKSTGPTGNVGGRTLTQHEAT